LLPLSNSFGKFTRHIIFQLECRINSLTLKLNLRENRFLKRGPTSWFWLGGLLIFSLWILRTRDVSLLNTYRWCLWALLIFGTPSTYWTITKYTLRSVLMSLMWLISFLYGGSIWLLAFNFNLKWFDIDLFLIFILNLR
jgi:hypothetical protein